MNLGMDAIIIPSTMSSLPLPPLDCAPPSPTHRQRPVSWEEFCTTLFPATNVFILHGLKGANVLLDFVAPVAVTTPTELRSLLRANIASRVDVRGRNPDGASPFVVDIDMCDEWTKERKECACGEDTRKVCDVCWAFVRNSMAAFDQALDLFGFPPMVWFFSGRRGVHGYSIVPQLTKLPRADRGQFIDELVRIAKEFSPTSVRFDRGVVTGRNHPIRLAFSHNPETRFLAACINPATFLPSKAIRHSNGSEVIESVTRMTVQMEEQLLWIRNKKE